MVSPPFSARPNHSGASGVARPSRGPSWRGLALVGASVATTLVLPLPGAAAAQAAPGGSFLQTFSPANEGYGGARSGQQAVADARNFDVLVALPTTYRGHVGAMRAANPRLNLMAYMNATFAQSSQASAYPESWYVRDRNGNKVRSRGYGNYMMDPTNQGWIESRVSTCRSLLAQSGYGGCMLDMLGTAPTLPSYVTSPGINPRTRAPWTATDWQRATTELARRVNVSTSGQLWGNGYGSSSRYFASGLGQSRTLSSGVDGALTEVWIRTATQSVNSHPSPDRWRDSVEQLVHLGRNGDRTAVLVKIWAPGSTAQKDAVHRFSLATFLLGSDGRSAFYASYGHRDALAGHRYWNHDVGTPTGSYQQIGAAFSRTFTRGRVLVNPSSSPVTVQLGGPHRDLNGAVRTSVTLPPHSGDVFQRV